MSQAEYMLVSIVLLADCSFIVIIMELSYHCVHCWI